MIAVVVLGLAVLGLVYVLYEREQDHDRQILKLEERARKERYDLTSRIQNPGFTPRAEPVPQPEREPMDDLPKIGTISPIARKDESSG